MSIKEVIISDIDRNGVLVPQNLSMGNVIIMFYADWCGHCKTAKPEFLKASKVTKGMKFGWIDWDKAQRTNVGLVRDWPFKVEGYPTFVVFQNGVATGYYQGPRTADGFRSIPSKLK